MILVAKGANIEQANNGGETALTLAPHLETQLKGVVNIYTEKTDNI